MRLSGATGMLIPEDTIFTGDIDKTSLVSSSQETVLGNDTIYTIAARTGRDWKEIVALNNLEYPYVTSNPMEALSPVKAATHAPKVPPKTITLVIPGISPKQGDVLAFDGGNYRLDVQSFDGYFTTLAVPAPAGIPTGGTVTLHDKQMAIAIPGQKLLIPGDDSTIRQISHGSEDFESGLYGIDEFLDDDGTMYADRKDIMTLSGMQNLAMQLYHRINTTKGELTELGHPEYGSLVPTYIGKSMTPVWEERILLECRLTVEADPRVKHCDNIKLFNSGTAIFFEADIYPINNQDPIAVSIPIA
jgi:hypothetical protein